jgi:hypothetical protein
MDDHYKAQVDAIAEALQELVSGPDDSVEKALGAIDAAIDSWLDYFETLKGKSGFSSRQGFVADGLVKFP